MEKESREKLGVDGVVAAASARACGARVQCPLAIIILLLTVASYLFSTNLARISLLLFAKAQFQSSAVDSSTMTSQSLPPVPPPQWVVDLNSPKPRPSKAAASIPDPPGFTSSRSSGKNVCDALSMCVV